MLFVVCFEQGSSGGKYTHPLSRVSREGGVGWSGCVDRVPLCLAFRVRGNCMGNPGVFQRNPYLYLQKPIPVCMGMGFVWVQVRVCVLYLNIYRLKIILKYII